jgi:predicted lactoylglutathione lyase
MSRIIFVNLPVSDVAKSRLFYQALGFTINEAFSDERAACVVISPQIYVMILHRDYFQTFTALPVGAPSAAVSALCALSCESRAEVDAMTKAALSAGGGEPVAPRDLGFMYNRSFTDLDGHVFEPFWMDPAAANG